MEALIKYLSDALTKSGCKVINCRGEADAQVAKSAITFAKRKIGSCVVVADDSDIAIMLLYHWNDKMEKIWFVQQRSFQAWDIRTVENNIKDTKKDLLFIHAWSGCDSTSSVYGKGKVTVAKLVISSKELQNVSQTFMNQTCQQIEICQASILAFKLLYGGCPDASLARLRYQKFNIMSGRGVISPECLPLTDQAAHYHGLRAFYQIMEWGFFDIELINPQDWDGDGRKMGILLFR